LKETLLEHEILNGSCNYVQRHFAAKNQEASTAELSAMRESCNPSFREWTLELMGKLIFFEQTLDISRPGKRDRARYVFVDGGFMIHGGTRRSTETGMRATATKGKDVRIPVAKLAWRNSPTYRVVVANFDLRAPRLPKAHQARGSCLI